MGTELHKGLLRSYVLSLSSLKEKSIFARITKKSRYGTEPAWGLLHGDTYRIPKLR